MLTRSCLQPVQKGLQLTGSFVDLAETILAGRRDVTIHAGRRNVTIPAGRKTVTTHSTILTWFDGTVIVTTHAGRRNVTDILGARSSAGQATYDCKIWIRNDT